jgi:hypothetical protein
MMKVVKIKGLCSKPLQRRILEATDAERHALRGLADRERDWIINKMHRKGYELEAVVAAMVGIFTRGPARGTLEVQKTVGTEQ